jgi:hypothetical protein
LVLQALPRLALAIALCAACGKKPGSGSGKDDAASAAPGPAPLAMPPLGVDRVQRFNFIYGEGESAYATAVTKAKAKDWAATKNACEAALAKDPFDLDAHRLLATALVQQGDHAAAVDHLVAALAADYYAYAPTLDAPELAAFRATPHGQAVAALAREIGAEYAKRAKAGLLLVGRRSTFKWPEKPGVQPDGSRGELYAYDRDSKRYLRLTHTDHQVAGFVRAPGGGSVALLGFDRVERGATDADPPLLARGWLLAIDPADWKSLGPRVTLPSAREVIAGYGAGDQLLVATAQATGRWTLGDLAISSVDVAGGKLTKTSGAVTWTPRVELTLDEGRAPHAPDATKPGGDKPSVVLTTPAGGTVRVPESGDVDVDSIATSPDGARVAFATAVDPCAKDTAPSLYVADAKTGALKHLLTARSRFATRWVDATTLAYEDGDGSIRLWDATTGREATRLDDKAGLALDVLSLASGPLCKQAPPTAPAGSGEEPPLPPEEPAPAQ